jgi:hypothetical protein
MRYIRAGHAAFCRRDTCNRNRIAISDDLHGANASIGANN